MSRNPISLRIEPELLAQIDEVARRTGKVRSETMIELLRAALTPLPEPDLPPAEELIRKIGRLDEVLGRLLYHTLGTTPEPDDPEASVALADQRMRRLIERMEKGSIWKKFTK